MLLVFGGTTEGRHVAEALAAAGRRFVYSTKSQVGMPPLRGMQLRHGALTGDLLVALCRDEGVRGIVHAGHPFAEQLHRAVADASRRLALPVWRLERHFPARDPRPWLTYVAGYAAALECLVRLDREPLLALTGVQTIAPLRPWWERRRTYFQILNRPMSWALAQAEGFPREQLIGRAPWKDAAKLAGEIRRLGIRVLITKESGESGFQPEKSEAARLTQTPLIVIERPALPPDFRLVHDTGELLARLARELP